MKIIKRNGAEETFDVTKIINAIQKANDTVDDKYKLTRVQVQRIAQAVVLSCE